MKKYLPYLILVVVVLAGIALWRYSQSTTAEPVVNEAGQNSSPASLAPEVASNPEAGTDIPSTTQTTPPVSSEDEVSGGVDTQVFEISYDGKSFSPASSTIRLGDVVIFKNESSGKMWPASAPHPTHTDYPEFDPKAAVAAGDEWQFKFEKVGVWKFHDHINPSAYGSITVEQ